MIKAGLKSSAQYFIPSGVISQDFVVEEALCRSPRIATMSLQKAIFQANLHESEARSFAARLENDDVLLEFAEGLRRRRGQARGNHRPGSLTSVTTTTTTQIHTWTRPTATRRTPTKKPRRPSLTMTTSEPLERKMTSTPEKWPFSTPPLKRFRRDREGGGEAQGQRRTPSANKKPTKNVDTTRIARDEQRALRKEVLKSMPSWTERQKELNRAMFPGYYEAEEKKKKKRKKQRGDKDDSSSQRSDRKGKKRVRNAGIQVSPGVRSVGTQTD